MITYSVGEGPDRSQVFVEDDGQPIAHVAVSDDGAAVDLRFSVNQGRVPLLARELLVEAAFGLPPLKEARRVHATLPVGDVELLSGLRRHCSHVTTRVAGATCLIDAEVAP